MEGEVTVMRSTHTNAIQDLKSKFLAEKRTYQNESDSKINTMTKLANTVSIDRKKVTKKCCFDGLQEIRLSHRWLHIPTLPATNWSIKFFVKRSHVLIESLSKIHTPCFQLLALQFLHCDYCSQYMVSQREHLSNFPS